MQYPESYYAAAAPGQQSLSEGSSDIAPCTDKNPLPPPIVSSAVPKKPIRPLTAYHIFFQIEREYIIQTCAGQDDDVSIHDGKVYLAHVPPRYRKTKLLPLWYAGPGKRQKRKHRKQHGKISFLDLSRAISARWAKLEEVDPETKRFVERIARQEIEIYYHEMKHYKEITKDAPQAPTGAVPGHRKSKHITVPAPQAPPVSAASSMDTAASMPVSVSQSDTDVSTKQLLDELANSVPGSDVPRLSSDSSVHHIHRRRKTAQHRQDSMAPHRQNSLTVQHRENSLSLSNLDPMLVALNFMDASKKRRTGTDASHANAVMAEVDIPDADILRMWLSQNAP